MNVEFIEIANAFDNSYILYLIDFYIGLEQFI